MRSQVIGPAAQLLPCLVNVWTCTRTSTTAVMPLESALTSPGYADVGGLLAAAVPAGPGVQSGGQVEADLRRAGVGVALVPGQVRHGVPRRDRAGLVGREAGLPADHRLRCLVRGDPGADAADRGQQQYDDHEAAEEPPGPGGERGLGLGRPRRLPGLEHLADRTRSRVRAVRRTLSSVRVCAAAVPAAVPPASGRRGRRGGAITPPGGGAGFCGGWPCGAAYCAATPCAWRGVGDTGPSGWAHHSGAVLCGRPLPAFFRR